MIRRLVVAASTIAALTFFADISSGATVTRQAVLGTWKLVSVETLRQNGQVSTIWMGPNPIGLIIYQPNGYMSVRDHARSAARFC